MSDKQKVIVGLEIMQDKKDDGKIDRRRGSDFAEERSFLRRRSLVRNR